MKKVMIVDDDDDIRIIIRTFLEGAGYLVLDYDSAISALQNFDNEVSLVILDVSMPEMDGIQMCKELREFSDIPVLFLTARTQEVDIIMGLNAGGDDYLSKPFSHYELVARVGALTRRFHQYKNKQINEHKVIELEQMEVDTRTKTVKFNGKVIDFAEREYQILLLLATHRGQIFSIPELYETIWGEEYLYDSANTVMVHIRKIRMKIETDPSKPRIIKNVWGKGYRIDD